MYPKSFYGWYNKLVRGHPYNYKTQFILDHSFKPSKRSLSALEDRHRSNEPTVLNKKKLPLHALLSVLKFKKGTHESR